MKKNVFFVCFYILAFLVVVINSVYLVLDNVFVDISDVPDGDYQFSQSSPEGDKVLKVYYVETGVGNAVRITKTEKNKTENVFWQTNESDANIYWQNNDVVIINGIIVDFSKNEVFDSRHVRSIFNDGLMGWN